MGILHTSLIYSFYQSIDLPLELTANTRRTLFEINSKTKSSSTHPKSTTPPESKMSAFTHIPGAQNILQAPVDRQRECLPRRRRHLYRCHSTHLSRFLQIGEGYAAGLRVHVS